MNIIITLFRWIIGPYQLTVKLSFIMMLKSILENSIICSDTIQIFFSYEFLLEPRD